MADVGGDFKLIPRLIQKIPRLCELLCIYSASALLAEQQSLDGSTSVHNMTNWVF